MLGRLRFFFAQAFLGLWRSLGITSLSVVTITVTLVLLGAFALVLLNLEDAAEGLRQEVEISAYLDPTTSEQDGIDRARVAAGWSAVKKARFVSSVEAMTWLEKSLGRDAIVLDGLPADVLPPSIEVRLRKDAWTSSQLGAVVRQLRGLEGVEDVRYGREDLARVEAILHFAWWAALIIGVTLCLAAILIVSNTIRLAVYARRDEIEILSLIGATDGFVRTPFVIEGTLQGLMGAAMALGTLAVLRSGLAAAMEQGLSYAYQGIQIDFALVELAGGLVLVGVVLGFCGSTLAVGRFVRV